MVQFDWNDEKDEKLRRERGVSFEEVVFHIFNGDILSIVEHPNQRRYAGQKIMFLRMGDYVYMVPYQRQEDVVFLKTIIPSRKATQKYLRKNEWKF